MHSKLARPALLTSAGLIVGYIEFLVMPTIGVPGFKLGLANISTLVALYMLGYRGALAVCIARVTLSGLLFGSLSSLMYALSGALAAFAVMSLIKKTGRFSVIGVSCAGGAAHNIAQLAVAALVARTPGLMYYAPALLLFGTLAGAAMGFLSGIILKRVR